MPGGPDGFASHEGATETLLTELELCKQGVAITTGLNIKGRNNEYYS